MKTLSETWFADGYIDFELKKYTLLAYLQEINRAFNENKLYPQLPGIVERSLHSQFDFGADIAVQLFHAERIAWSDAILLSAGFDNCMHMRSSVLGAGTHRGVPRSHGVSYEYTTRHDSIQTLLTPTRGGGACAAPGALFAGDCGLRRWPRERCAAESGALRQWW